MRVVWFHEVVDKSSLREHMKGARWLLIRQEDLEKATQAWMFAELDGFLIGVDHRLSEFKLEFTIGQYICCYYQKTKKLDTKALLRS